MPIDPNIALSVKTPEIVSPLQTVGAIMQMRNMGSEMAFRNAQTQQAQEQTRNIQAQEQQRVRDLQSANQVQDLLRDPVNQKKLGSGDYSPIWNAGITPGVAEQAIKSLQGMQTTAQTLASGKAAFYASGRQALAAGLEGLHPTDDTAAAAQYNGFRQTLAADHPELAQGLPQLNAGPEFRRQLQDLAASNGVAHAILENQAALESKKATTAESSAKAAEATTTAALNTAKTPGALAESGLKQLEFTSAGTVTPETIAYRAAAMFNPDNYTDPNIKAQVLNEQRTAIQAATSAVPLGIKAVNDAFKDSSDRLGRLTSGVAQANATVPAKISVAVGSATARADAAGLTDDDYARAGEQYSRTGVMPAVGRDSITRGKIVHAANQWAADNGLKPADVVTMQAAYAGDKDSLKKFQAQRDQIVSFEQTAQKNLDLMLTKAQPLIDSGSPLLNQPLRSINRNALGANDQAAFDAALLVANNEVAKVTSGGGLGGVLSDSARHEVDQMNPKSATLGQYIAVAKVLKQDMANRHQSMDASLSDIKARIGGGSGTDGSASYVRTADGPNGHKIGQKADGAWYDMQTGQKVQ